MIPVSRIYNKAKAILGSCGDAALFEDITMAVEMLANKGDFDPLLGSVDIVPNVKTVTLPNDVETIFGASISGIPTIGQNRLYQFHLNGPGDRDFSACGYRWIRDGFQYCTFIDPAPGSQLSASVELDDDIDSECWVEGYNSAGVIIRTETTAGNFQTGYLVPTAQVGGTPAPALSAPLFDRITRVRTDARKGALYLYATKDAVTTLIGVYQWNETEPRFRRITVDQTGETVRVLFRRRIFEIKHVSDLIPLHSPLAVLEAIRAVKALGDDDVQLAAQHEAMAMRYISEKEDTLQAPFAQPIQVDPRNLLQDKSDDVS